MRRRWLVPLLALGSMATLPVPPAVRERFTDPETFQARLYDQHRIEVPIIEFNDGWWIRVSCQVYNEAGQYRQLGEAVVELST